MKTTIKITVDTKLFKQVQKILKENNLTFDKAIELYFIEIIRLGRLPVYNREEDTR